MFSVKNSEKIKKIKQTGYWKGKRVKMRRSVTIVKDNNKIANNTIKNDNRFSSIAFSVRHECEQGKERKRGDY